MQSMSYIYFFTLRMASCVLVCSLESGTVGSELFFMPRIPRKSLKNCRKILYKNSSRAKVIHYFFSNFFQFLYIV